MSTNNKVEPGKTYTVQVEGKLFEAKVIRPSQDVPNGWLVETKSGHQLIIPDTAIVGPATT